jgi:7,8-dihydropterin-6-yl-methyl-4-(beta-D-ribofuranosyl)aminobenzene 5'-phosphate synthase
VACTDVQITIVVDNKSCGGLAVEHGFALWIEVPGHRILFDTGQGTALHANAARLGCDLSQVDTLVLSHGHYDHCGALSSVLNSAPTCRVYCHAGAFVPRYSVRPGEAPRTISLASSDRDAIHALSPNQVHWVSEPGQIITAIGLSGPIPRIHPMEDTGGPFFLDPDGHRPDPLEDDLALWIKTERGLVIITGCCHAGLINSVDHLRSISGVERVFGIIGGLHLVNASIDRLLATTSALRNWKPEFIIPCHCTGDEATAFLCEQLGSMVNPGYAGLKLTLSEENVLSFQL